MNFSISNWYLHKYFINIDTRSNLSLFNCIYNCIFSLIKIIDHPFRNSISEGLAGTDYIHTIVKFFADNYFDTGLADIKGNIIMFLHLIASYTANFIILLLVYIIL